MKTKSLILACFIKTMAFSQAINVDLIPSKDNSIFSESGSESSGKGLYIFAGKTLQNTRRRGLLQFNLSSIPANATITGAVLSIATLRSASNTTTAHQFTIHKLLKDFGEGTSVGIGNGVPATEFDATWSQNFYLHSSWTTAGADFETIPSATSLAVLNDYAVWNDNLKNDVQFWIQNTAQNFGWLIKGDENTGGSAKGFASKDNAIFQPVLSISYTIPAIENVFINEINPKKHWIEIYNPSSNEVDLSTYFLKNGNSQTAISNSMVLNGNLNIMQQHYTIINYDQLNPNIDEVALYKGNPAANTSTIKDYLQYGAANQSMANIAVAGMVWNNANSFLTSTTLDSMSYSANPNTSYLSGKNTNSTSFLIQRETPSFKNLPCANQITLKDKVMGAKYTAQNEITLQGELLGTTLYELISQKSIVILPTTKIPASIIFEAKIGGCW